MHCIRFLPQRGRLRDPARLKTNQVNTDPETLRDLHGYAHIGIAGHHRGIANGLITGQVYKVGYKKGVDLFLLADAVDGAESKFDVSAC